MGEIRSTLDIIMEKARGVQVTDDDKAAFVRHEVKGKIRGLLQKALDGFIDVEDMQSEMETLGTDRHEIAVAALRQECLERLALEGDNRYLLNILSRAVGVDVRPVEKILLSHREDLEKKRVHREALLRDQLKIRGISGSAVVPNLKGDAEWVDTLAGESDRFQQELAGFHPGY